ncbi:MAG: translation elongation factor Ts [Lachnospiraceae bacterium]|nr:translation elongation factor Ts [Lachnospiraceae bacterium]
MAEITASLVKELREATGAGMMDCKKALSDPEVNGDIDKAVEFLRKKGLAASAKKANRIAAEGVVKTAISADGKNAVVVEVNSETDFVAKNEKFTSYVQEVADQALTSSAATVEEFLNEKWALDSTLTVSEKLSSMVALIGEKLTIRRFEKISGDAVVSYIHGDGKIGVLVAANTTAVNDEVSECLKNVAMQIAAMNAKYVTSDEVPEDYKNHERQVIAETVAADPKFAGKPEKVIAGAIEGKLNKELKDVVLLEQEYVKSMDDSDKTVKKYVEKVAKATGSNLSVKSFVRLERGEGLEKKVDDFAAEVAAQAAAAQN